MKKRNLYYLFAILFGVCSCTNTKTSSADGEIQIDPELQELGELNIKLMEFDEIGIPQNGVVPVRQKGQWGLLAKDGKEILPCMYSEISFGENENVWIVNRNDSIGIVDNKGSFINDLRTQFTSYTCLGGGLLLAVWGNLEERQYVIPMKYQGTALLGDVKSATPACDGVIMTEYFGNYKLYSYAGDSLSAISDDYQHFTGQFGEGLYCVTNGWDGKYGYINTKGEIAVPFEFDTPCGVFSDGMATYTDSEGHYGYIDKKGNIVIPAKFNYAEKYSDGLAYVSGDDEVGYIDKSGNLIIDPKGQYGGGNGFVKGFSVVIGSETDLMGIINKKGELVVPIEYVINPLSDDMYVSCTSGDSTKYGAFTLDGKGAVPFEYDNLSDFHDGLALATKEGVNFVVNKEGKTGILNFDEVLSKVTALHAQEKANAEKELEERIKEQIMERVNRKFGREVIGSTVSVKEFEKQSDGTYTGEFTDRGEYEYIVYTLYDITVDENGVLQDCGWKWKATIPTAKERPNRGVNAEDQMRYYQKKVMEGNRYNPYK